MSEEFVSILMLTHNAPKYVEISIRSVMERTSDVDYELVVLDNASEAETRDMVSTLHQEGLIQKLVLLERNSLFAEGNNLAALQASSEATHYLLLNSDIEIKDAQWLRHLLDNHKRGITSYGTAVHPDRVDGYCLLIDADLYKKHRLNEDFQWWWSVTRLQAHVLNDGHAVRGYSEHEKYIHHFGGKSGNAFKNAKGMGVSREEVYSWFNGKSPTFIDRNVLSTAMRKMVRFVRRRI